MELAEMPTKALNDELYESRKAVYDKARGDWPTILRGLGVDPHFLRSKQAMPCPFCGGRDRYTFDDRRKDGDYCCRGCGAGKGVTFLMKYHGWTWVQAVDEVLAYLKDPDNGHLLAEKDERRAAWQRRMSQSDVERQREKYREVWEGARRVMRGDPVHRYLTMRVPGLTEVPDVIRYHPALDYYRKPGEGEGNRAIFVGKFPAMVTMLQDSAGEMGNIHRTWLTDEGQKARIVTEDGEILDSRKLMPSIGAVSLAARLVPGEHRELGVAEGLETALAAIEFANVPTWSVVSTSGMRKFLVPEWVEVLTIFADNDLPDSRGKRPGFEAAYALAKREDVVQRVQEKSLRVNVRTPSKIGTDIADLLQRIAANRSTGR